MSDMIPYADDVTREIVDTTTGEIHPAERNDLYRGIGSVPFSAEAIAVLLRPITDDEVDMRPDGLIYLAEIKYRRVLNRAFGPGAWGIFPQGITVNENMMYYRGALIVHGRFVSEAIGEQEYFPNNGRMSYATAAESAKSNCMMRTCKDLGIASELWEPQFVRRWIETYATEVWCINIGSGEGRGKKRKMWRKKTDRAIDMFPWQEEKGQAVEDRSQPAQLYNGGITHTVDELREKQAVEVKSSDNTTITFRQVKRLKAIGEKTGFSPSETVAYVRWKLGVDPEEVPRSHYDAICSGLDSKDQLAAFREVQISGGLAKPATEPVAATSEKSGEQVRQELINDPVGDGKGPIETKRGLGKGSMIHILAKSEGWTEDAVHLAIEHLYGVTSANDLDGKEISLFNKVLRSHEDRDGYMEHVAKLKGEIV